MKLSEQDLTEEKLLLQSLSKLTPSMLEQLSDEQIIILEQNLRSIAPTKLELYRPYPKQKLFHALGSSKRERLLRAGNQLGKSFCGSVEAALHATGRYPDWWEGKVMDRGNLGWCGGVTGEVTRDTIQRLLIGAVGTNEGGMIPRSDIIDISPARGVSGLVDTIIVRHVSGGKSRIRLKYYEQGREKWQADTVNWVWFDEEPPEDIYTEGLTRTNATGGIAWTTFTPLLGMSNVVRRFLTESSMDRADVNMTIEDAEHIPLEERKKIIASYPAHEREARINGTPILGSGRIFPMAEEDISCDAFEPDDIPEYWIEIGGLDFGWHHPTAAAKILYDPEDDVIYVINCYKRKEATPIIHASALKPWGKELAWAWPQDGLQHDKTSGQQLAKLYEEEGLNMLSEHAQFEDDRGNSVEAGITEMLMRMETGRFKVYKHLREFFEEFRLYHRKDGKVVKEYDDIICAVRYALMCLRFATPRRGYRLPKRKDRGSSWMSA